MTDNRAEQVFQEASSQRTWYYYAATGISISGKVIQFIEERDCDNYFYDNNIDINLYNFSQCLYNEFFVGFNSMWIEKGYYDIINGSDLSSGILASGTLVYDENYELEYPKSTKVKSMFDYCRSIDLKQFSHLFCGKPNCIL